MRDPDEVYIQVAVGKTKGPHLKALPSTAKDPTPAQIEQRLRFAAAAKLSRGLRGDEQRKFVGELIRGPVSAPHRVLEPKWKQHLRRLYVQQLEAERAAPQERGYTDEQLEKIARALGGGG